MSTLREQLEELRTRSLSRPTEITAVIQKEIDRLGSTTQGWGLQMGEKAPDFTLPDALGQPVTLYESLTKGPVVLTFYRGNW
jgi:hypothetical protein